MTELRGIMFFNRLLVLMCLSLPATAVPVVAQESSPPKYSPAVVKKAEKILEDAGLRQVGKTIQPTGLSEISRALAALPRQQRELRLVHQAWERVDHQVTAIRSELERLNAQYGELNLRLGRVAGNVTANNQTVGLINATTAKIKSLATQLERVKEELAKKRSELSAAEADYAGQVLSIRQNYNQARDQLAEAMRDEQVKIALQVMHTNFETPSEPTADEILASVDKRIERIEEDIFRDTIALEVAQGSLYVDVVVGEATTRMVVDSGATMVSLPIKTANELGVQIPPDARRLQLVLADGSAIPARAVTLPKVRVGQFEVENVEAAVLDAVAGDAEPLLGMSFLGHFKFEVNTGEKSLKLLKVETE